MKARPCIADCGLMIDDQMRGCSQAVRRNKKHSAKRRAQSEKEETLCPMRAHHSHLVPSLSFRAKREIFFEGFGRSLGFLVSLEMTDRQAIFNFQSSMVGS